MRPHRMCVSALVTPLMIVAMAVSGLSPAVADPAADKSLFIALYGDFYRILVIHWAGSVGLSALGYLLLLFAVAAGQSALPRASACLTPVPVGILIAATCRLFPFSTAAAMIGSATFNLASWFFYLVVLVCLRGGRRCSKPSA